MRRLAPLAVVAAVIGTGCADGELAAGTRWREPLSGMEFAYVPAGTYRIGSPESEPGHEAQEALHQVTLSRGFWIGRFEVTQAEWSGVMGPEDRPWVRAEAEAPVENVDWYEAIELARRLSDRSTGERFRLPTEAEWEIACRAGTSTPYATGELLSSEQANYDARYPLPGQAAGEYRGRTTAAGTFSPNAWGLHDFHGNVWEWTADDHCPYAGAGVHDPLGLCASGLKVIRGGSWLFNADSARCAVRYTHAPRLRGPSLGLRLVREVGD